MKRVMAFLLALSLLPFVARADQIDPVERQEDEVVQVNGCMVSHSTERSGSVSIWVPQGYPDVDSSHWFFAQLQNYRLMGILQGDETGAAQLDRVVSAAEVYTLFVRYIYSDTYTGQSVGAAIYGDYTFQGQAAWLNAYETVTSALRDTLDRIGKNIYLPAPGDQDLTRGKYFVLYAMAALHKAQDPAWFLGQFSDTQLGTYARSGQPIRTYTANVDVTTYFAETSILDEVAMMTPLEIQCANLLMYLGVLEGTEQHTLDPNGLLDRASAVKLLASMDLMDTEPHREESGDGQKPSDDWGTVNPTPTPTPPEPELEHHPVPILFADLDNNIVGALPVMTNTDIREQLDEYVKTNLVHPALRDGDPNDTSRENTYRQDNAYTCTRYLDYAMIRSPIEHSGRHYVVQNNGSKEYQWAWGWAVSSVQDYEDTWTVLGVGELEDWDGSAFSSPSLQILDPEKGVREGVVLKPIVRPGPLMYYGTEEEPANYRFIAASRWFFNSQQNRRKVERNALLATHSALDRGDVGDQYGNWMDYLPADSTPLWYTKTAEVEVGADLVDLTGTDFQPTVVSSDSEWKSRYSRDVAGMQALTFERSHVMPDGTIQGVPFARDLIGDIIYHLDMTENFQDLQGLYGDNAATNWIAFDNQRYFGHYEEKVIKGGDTVAVCVSAVSPIHYCVVVLKDQYNANFITGQLRGDPWRTINNFNYDMPSRNTLHPAAEKVGDAAGTYGFFTDVGISYWLEEYGEDTYWLFNQISAEALNLDMPLILEQNSHEIYVQQAMFEMVGDLINCIYTHGHNDNEEFWDPWLDEPRIDYHQLQLYIYDWEQEHYNNGPKAHVKSKAEADATIIPHCRLHFECQAAN